MPLLRLVLLRLLAALPVLLGVSIITFALMAATIAVLTFLYGVAVTAATHVFAERLRASPAVSRALSRLAGIFMIGFGVKLVLSR